MYQKLCLHPCPCGWPASWYSLRIILSGMTTYRKLLYKSLLFAHCQSVDNRNIDALRVTIFASFSIFGPTSWNSPDITLCASTTSVCKMLCESSGANAEKISKTYVKMKNIHQKITSKHKKITNNHAKWEKWSKDGKKMVRLEKSKNTYSKRILHGSTWKLI